MYCDRVCRIAEIDQKANVLLEGLSVDTKGFVDTKLRDMGTERRKLQARSEALETAPTIQLMLLPFYGAAWRRSKTFHV